MIPIFWPIGNPEAPEFLSLYGVTFTRAIVAFRSDLDGPGVVEITSQNDLFVEMDAIYQGERDAILAILAHEMTHIFLHKVGLGVQNVQENEILTDVTAMFLGFGLLLLNSNGIIVRRVGKQMHFGYLSLAEQGYVLAKRCAYFGLDFRADLRKGLPKAAFSDGKIRLKREAATIFPNRRVLRECKASAAEPEGTKHGHEEVRCIMCSQRLSLPPRKAKGIVTCPVCKTEMRRP